MTNTGLRGKRYGEVLLVSAGPDGPQATVYNTYPLNDCPPELWHTLDAAAIATEHGALAALLNGPKGRAPAPPAETGDGRAAPAAASGRPVAARRRSR